MTVLPSMALGEAGRGSPLLISCQKRRSNTNRVRASGSAASARPTILSCAATYTKPPNILPRLLSLITVRPGDGLRKASDKQYFG